MAPNPQEFIDGINPKKIYYFQSTHLKNSTEPHYFVCVGFDSENVMILSLFTTQMEKKINFIETRGLEYSTLVFVKPTSENGLKEECCVNCNDVYLHSKSEFLALFHENGIKCKGELEDVYYAQIYNGINDSTLIEEETKIKIIHVDEPIPISDSAPVNAPSSGN